ncbi:hypothetical protein cand_012940 [Cryptosporidium andersoni]|uniref:rRNA-processing protein FYV7 n=1 Tax=Cryptosporidium andersoni TaxID=117008 RepID=A0A1J4MDP1_9CRYT|nr:hypothetical protein cand_012940 [Cryptosporidium andersoni]
MNNKLNERRKKSNPFQAALKEAYKRKVEKEERENKIRELRREKKRKLEERHKRKIILCKRTSKGQPILGGAIKLILNKLEAEKKNRE